MADVQDTEPTRTDPAAREPHGTDPADQTVSRAEYDKLLAESRKWESRAKENKDAAKRLAELEDASKTDAEKLADATKRMEAAEARLADYERRAERAGIVAEVAAAKGVDAEWLDRMAGDTREEVEANADFIAAKLVAAPIYPSVQDSGAKPAAPITREEIEAIKDPKKRVIARAQNISLYK
ncbi:hypothetical protein [Enorma massiliensis]|uniref:hypothetical protein n=1 Tax=Enorma massiliensis TaxID=1472761 RepID=UPI0023F53093|nr:hypothetical protein [Enorma massiliensis]